jgi:hypothetical protein
MTSRWVYAALLGGLLAGCSAQAPAPASDTKAPTVAPAEPAGMPMAPPTTDEGIIKSAMAAAPDAISKDATVISMDDKMQVRTLKTGTNGWTCMADNPVSPGADPMCLDKNAMAWAEAWMARKDPPKDKIGIAYMLMGGSDASNEDPFATKPVEGRPWVDTGPHLMILNAGDRLAPYPTTHENTKVPYVMFPNTPYAHLMIPVK